MQDRKTQPPFVPVTGNPEGHDYLDWYRHLVSTGQIEEPLEESASQVPPAFPADIAGDARAETVTTPAPDPIGGAGEALEDHAAREGSARADVPLVGPAADEAERRR